MARIEPLQLPDPVPLDRPVPFSTRWFLMCCARYGTAALYISPAEMSRCAAGDAATAWAELHRPAGVP